MINADTEKAKREFNKIVSFSEDAQFSRDSSLVIKFVPFVR